MKRALIFINIGMVILLSILLGCNKNEPTTAWREVTVDSIAVVSRKMESEESKLPAVEEKREYEIQLMASTNLSALKNEQKDLLLQDFQTKIVPHSSHGNTYYRLRLIERFSHQEAKAIAVQIENDNQNIQKVWIQKML